MHSSVNVVCQGKSGTGKIHEVNLVQRNLPMRLSRRDVFDQVLNSLFSAECTVGVVWGQPAAKALWR